MAKAKEPKDTEDTEDKPLTRDEEIANLFKAAKKKYGTDVLCLAKDFGFSDIPRISTGILPLDYRLGGGIPVGRLTMAYGHKSSSKTTMLLRTVGNAQRMCSDCWTVIEKQPIKKEGDVPVVKCVCGNNRRTKVAWLDVEGVWDKSWSKRFLDIDDLAIAQPTTAEQTINVADMLLRSGAVDIIVIDSIAFMTSQVEIDKGAEESTMGLQARLVGQQMRKFVSGINLMGQESGRRPTVLFTNQIRQKVGVMYGCFHGDTLVTMADGQQLPIRTIVKNRIAGPVKSWNKETGEYENANIVGWHKNGKIDPGSMEYWISIKTTGAGGPNGCIGFTCTPNHRLFRIDGAEISAGEVVEGETLLSYSYEQVLLDDVHKDVIYGSLLGDGHLARNDVDTACFMLANQEQPEYLEWKCSMVPMLGMRKSGSEARPSIRSGFSTELRSLRDLFYPSDVGYRQIPDGLKLTPLMAAVWYMDDGSLKKDRVRPTPTISIKRFANSPEQILRARSVMAEFVGCDISGVRYWDAQKVIAVTAEHSGGFFRKIACHIIPCMRYKLPADFRSIAYATSVPRFVKQDVVMYPATVTSVEVGSARKHRDLMKYDITVEGNSTYIVGGGHRGVVVHNSPDTIPGGLAQGFATSCEIYCKGNGKYTMDDDTGQPLSVPLAFRIEKNKTGGAKGEGEYAMALAKTEVKNVGEVLDEDWAILMGEKTGLIDIKGTTSVTWNGVLYRGKSQLTRHWSKDREDYGMFKKQLMTVLLNA